jgi:dTDP-4-amino-4,6-dideoxygalactose transaminase
MILMNDFVKEPPELIEGQKRAIEGVIKSGWFILGPKVEEFEKDWATYLNCSHVVGVANGMDAIEVGLRSLNLPESSEIITSPMTAFATVLAVTRAGHRPVLADIDPATGILDFESVKRTITDKTRAILLVHLYGRATDMDQWQELAASENLILIEDCAQSHGAKWHGKSLGTFGIFGAWSFYPTKNLGALGDGGAITTNDPILAERMYCLRNYGQSKRYHHPEIGLNSRLDELQAAILVERLKWLDGFTQRRREIANSYFDEIANSHVTKLSRSASDESHVHHLFVIKSQQRDALMNHLKSNHIASLIHYPIPIHHQPPCTDLLRDPNGLGNSERFAKECLSIPIHPSLTDSDVRRVITAVNSYSP